MSNLHFAPTWIVVASSFGNPLLAQEAPSAPLPAPTQDTSAPPVLWMATLGGTEEGRAARPRQGGGTGWLPRIVRGLSSDGKGGLFFCGSFLATCMLGQRNLSSAGRQDLLIGRLDVHGTPVWFDRFGGPGSDLAMDIAADRTGGCVVTGMCGPGARFDREPVVNAGGGDAWTARFGSDGALLWLRMAGGPRADSGNEICVDADDNVLVVGNTYGDMKADASAWRHVGGMDCFVLKYSADGALLWSLPITGPADVQGRAIAADPSGHVVVAGEFTGTIRVGDIELDAASAGRDAFVVRVSPSGQALWARRFGSGGEDFARGAGCDRAGNIVIAGVFSGKVSFGEERLQTGGSENLFVLTLSPEGVVLWARGITGPGEGHGAEIEVTADGKAFLVADLLGELAIDGAPLRSAGRREPVVACFTPDGRLAWVKQIRGSGTAATFDIALDPAGSVFLAGSYNGTLDADGVRLEASAPMGSFVIALGRGAEAESPASLHAGAGPHRVRELEVEIPAGGWQERMSLRIFVPDQGGPYPLVLFCAGTGGRNDTFSPISIHWASHGYAVLHTSYPMASRRTMRGNEALTRHRTADAVMVLDCLPRLPKLEPWLAGRIDLSRIAAAGHSSGAYIAQLLGGATVVFDGRQTSFRDERILAVMQFSGQGSDQQGLTKDSWKALTIPMLTLTGSRDRGATGGGPDWKKEPFDLSPPGNKHHACYDGGHHGSFSGKFARDPRGRALLEHSMRLTLAFLDAYLKHDEKALQQLRSTAPAQWSEARLDYWFR